MDEVESSHMGLVGKEVVPHRAGERTALHENMDEKYFEG
jgi:hypothetical protein